VADTFFDNPTTLGIARSDRFEDSLSGGTHQAHLGGPILVTSPDALHPATAGWVSVNPQVNNVWAYGGEAAIFDSVINAIDALLKS
jgi:hypothetical protein